MAFTGFTGVVLRTSGNLCFVFGFTSLGLLVSMFVFSRVANISSKSQTKPKTKLYKDTTFKAVVSGIILCGFGSKAHFKHPNALSINVCNFVVSSFFCISVFLKTCFFLKKMFPLLAQSHVF